DGRREPAARELAAEFVYGAGRSNRLGVGRNRLVGVVKRRAAADGVQTAGRPGVLAVHVVKAEPDVEAPRRGSLMVGAPEQVRRAIPGRIVAGGQARAGVAGSVERAVDGRRRGGGDRDKPGPTEAGPLEIREPEGPIGDDRTAAAETELVLVERILQRPAGRGIAPRRQRIG